MKRLYILLFAILLIIIAIGLMVYFKPVSTDDLTDLALKEYFSCVEEKHNENLCLNESSKVYQFLNKLDVEDKLKHPIRNGFGEKEEFNRIASKCLATKECTTYSCLNYQMDLCK